MGQNLTIECSGCQALRKFRVCPIDHMIAVRAREIGQVSVNKTIRVCGCRCRVEGNPRTILVQEESSQAGGKPRVTYMALEEVLLVIV